MSKINTGSSYEGPYQWSVPVAPSITLRDWFAGQVLAAACSEEGPETAAILAYEYADAMLAQREKQP
jgi:hypothetical protein